jgi:hypothetical protein
MNSTLEGVGFVTVVSVGIIGAIVAGIRLTDWFTVRRERQRNEGRREIWTTTLRWLAVQDDLEVGDFSGLRIQLRRDGWQPATDRLSHKQAANVEWAERWEASKQS